jgi:hypothetical protein
MNYLLLVTLLAACAQRVENIGNTLDQPPNGAVPEPETHAIRWAATFGTDGTNESRAVAFAPDGDVIAGISLSGLHDFGDGNGPLLAPAVTALLTRRAASDGHEIWTKTFAPGGFASVDEVAVDHGGAVIVAGSYFGTLQLGTATLQSDPTFGEMFVVKYDSAGDLAWVQRGGTAAALSPRALAVDAEGNVFVGAWFATGTLAFLGETYTATDPDAVLLAYAPDGTPRWSRLFQAPGFQSIDALAVGPSGEVAFAGSTSAPCSFGGAVFTPGYMNGVVGMLANDGSHLWSSMIGPVDPSGLTVIEGAVIDSTGRAIFQSQEQINNLLAEGVWPVQVVHAYDPSGTSLWTETIAIENSLRAMSLLPDDSLGSSAWIDARATHPDDPGGSWEMRKLAPDGSLSAIEQAGTRVDASPGGPTVIWKTATGASGEIAAVGEFAGTIDFDEGAVDGGTGHGSHAMLFVVDPQPAAAP